MNDGTPSKKITGQIQQLLQKGRTQYRSVKRTLCQNMLLQARNLNKKNKK
jgi:hypothetical protein